MNEFLALLAFLGILVHVDGDALKKYASRTGDAGVYHGRYTRNIQDPELLIPRRVSEDGTFDTYSLASYYDSQEVNARRKRSVETGSKGDVADDKVHLVLPFNGIDHHVELNAYHDFISPEMVIETRGAGISTNLEEGLRFKRAPDQQCHYRGTVRGHDNSKAALSLCDGVAGYIQTRQGRYFIEPANEAEPESDGQHVHIAYKREAPHEKKGDDTSGVPNRHCGTSDNWESAWAEQLAKREKRLAESNSLDVKRAPGTSGTHSIHRYIEIGLVADRRFLDFHNNSNYEQYLLTIMNMVSDFYHDKSSGNQIDVVVVRMIFLEKEKEEIDLLISPAAEETLDSFAKWAEKMNPKDHEHPNHYDIAVLVTRYDICSEGTECQLMGLAFVAAACDPPKAACINEDGGLLLGVVIAHEVGHVMGCSHDELQTSGCPPQDEADESYFLMSPIVFIYTIRWSRCSRKFITSFLESGLGDCLNDDPRNPPEKFKYPNMLPGAMYDGNFQCQMLFPGSKLCPSSEAIDCESLWCFRNNSCVSRGAPMAEGSKCGENKWCIKKKCVEIGSRPAAVNGGWSEWGPMSSCSRTCGGGVKYSERECDKPAPSNGGRYCIGERKRISICNTKPCDRTSTTFRALQCSSYDNKEVMSDGLHQWKPYIREHLEICALYCVNEKSTFVKLSPSVNDSTPCKPGTNYMCLSGTCRKVGCDWILDSDAVEDKCGICKGDGTKCSPVEGNYDVIGKGRQKFLTVPAGARSIHVMEKNASQNMFSVRTEANKTYCLNGGNAESRNGEYDCVGATIFYTHPEREREEIEIKGPISESIQILYVFFAKENPGIHYEYYVMFTNTSYTPKYSWDFLDWTECSAKCGGGTMQSEPICIEERGGKVSPNFCEGKPRPEPKSRVCNETPCPAKWRVSQWSKCSACDGKEGTKRRKVQCVKPASRPGEDDVQANLDACKGRVPKQKETCVGSRPCKKSCPKKTRNVEQPVADEKEIELLPLEDQRRMIDRFVDLSLEHYLEKARSSVHEDDKFVGDKFRQLVHDLPMTKSGKKQRICEAGKNFTTPKPGTVIKDPEPIENVVLMEAPYMEDQLPSNLSDKAFREAGDLVGTSFDKSQQKTYKGAEAVKKIEELIHNNSTVTKRSAPLNDDSNEIYERLSDIVDSIDTRQDTD